ncbi:RNA polymerase sigma factor (sigma-70 family) [Sphingobacterium alimentarium]|uniref:RNA polymerase sigma factor (Sigma-70 family) n=1 Tax=Sphingobacterium alimentarium TaxID=797292 RepID=A0A4R3VZC5_9SPHI|nr:sigma-70 family RNA polymerase sigma factor [Sphingobacterium alimentarium]TCV19486.1 RNA polymerase sigma factor (sigma-70 family) [Sphingobacterium alimentarium]
MSKIKNISSIEVSDTEIIAGIAVGDNRIINKIYKSFFPSIAHMIVSNNGSNDEAKDVFQEAVMVLYDKITQQQFELNSKLSTFLYAVSRRLWLKQLSRKGHTLNTTDISDFEDILHVEEDIQEHQEIENQFEQMNEAMYQLGEPCQTLLKDFYIKNLSMQEITEKFGYTNSDNAKTQKYKCLQRLKKIFFTNKIKE